MMIASQLVRTAEDPGAGQFLGVDWGSFVVVFLVALAATVVIVCFYALALRLLSLGSPLDGSDERAPKPSSATAVAVHRPPLATAAAVVCIAICAAAVLYGIWLIIPQFH
ncbi:hypothetical protein ACFVU2_12310 [Leifsonia sp. NPDC058194]|uniref:hypothetical protein n=1 Tax=Leifsonia sp. NPDC058194 TaxID=3346374 RepID=UPI0036DAA436